MSFTTRCHRLLRRAIFPAHLARRALGLPRPLVQAWQARSRRERDTQDLLEMNPRQLADLGLGRGDIPRLIRDRPADSSGATLDRR